MKCDGSGDDDDDDDLYGSFDMLSLLFNQLCCAIDCMLAICGYFMFSSCITSHMECVCMCVFTHWSQSECYVYWKLLLRCTWWSVNDKFQLSHNNIRCKFVCKFGFSTSFVRSWNHHRYHYYYYHLVQSFSISMGNDKHTLKHSHTHASYTYVRTRYAHA